jgi:predicted metal-dependent hydrolase
VEKKNNEPFLIGFVADLIFQSRIDLSASHLGYKTIWIENLEQISTEDFQDMPRQYAEHLVGAGADLIENLTLWKPALLIFDLGNNRILWREWIALIKSAPATRRTPVLCFGSHVAEMTMIQARDAGADIVISRSRFFSDMDHFIEKYAQPIDYQSIDLNCKQLLSDRAIEGIELFNQGEYFEAHEVLEQAWKEDSTPGRELYRAILQVAVAYLQIERENYSGALKMFLRMRQWIDPLPDLCRGVDVEQLRQDAQAVRRRILELGRERIAEFDRGLFHPVVYSKEP